MASCYWSFQVVYGDVYMIDDEMKWKELPPFPKPDSHIEFAWIVINNSIVIVGGTTEKHPVSKKMVLNGEVFQFNLDTLVLNSVPLLKYDNIFVHMFQVYAYDVTEKCAQHVTVLSFLLPQFAFEF